MSALRSQSRYAKEQAALALRAQTALKELTRHLIASGWSHSRDPHAPQAGDGTGRVWIDHHGTARGALNLSGRRTPSGRVVIDPDNETAEVIAFSGNLCAWQVTFPAQVPATVVLLAASKAAEEQA